jgi:glycosyltransferase involved in cell wall biosynthesis
MSPAPRVSILIPVRKPRLDWLRETLGSVLAQTLSDFEVLVVVDDVDPLPERLDDPRIRILHLPDAPGLPAALNFGVAHAAAPLIARLDADDVCEPRRLELQVAMFDADPALDVAGSQLMIIDEQSAPIGRRDYPTRHDDIVRAMQLYNPLAHPSVMFRKQRILDAGGYPIAPMEDYDLWCRMAVAGARFANHPERLVRYRYHRGITRGNVGRAIRASIDIKRRHFGASLTARARLRIILERLLLLVPPRWVSALFRMTQFRPLPRRESRGGARSS